jgi:hypothetical protein
VARFLQPSRLPYGPSRPPWAAIFNVDAPLRVDVVSLTKQWKKIRAARSTSLALLTQ